MVGTISLLLLYQLLNNCYIMSRMDLVNCRFSHWLSVFEYVHVKWLSTCIGSKLNCIKVQSFNPNTATFCGTSKHAE